MRRPRRLLLVTAAVAGLIVVPSEVARAHPLGNFTTNAHAHLRVGADQVRVDYVLDLAEIPALQATQGIDADDDGAIDDAEARAYRQQACADLVAGVKIRVDGEPLTIAVQGSTLKFPPGQAGLVTLRLECAFASGHGPFSGEHEVTFVDTNHEGRIGWREITAVGEGAPLRSSDVAEISASDSLRSYPEDLRGTPPQQRRATVVTAPSNASATATAPLQASGGAALIRGTDRFTASLTSLVAEQNLTLGFSLVAIGLAVLLGAMHALAPGHGKTVIAAYLVGQRGTSRQALMLGVTVAVSHTLGVVILGLLLSASETLIPERLYPWLGITSGTLFAAVGVALLRRAVANRRHGHRHDPDAHHHDDADDHDHGHGLAHDAAARPVGWRSLIAPGLAGGLIPSPSALVVLVGGITLGRAWFGLSLVVCYGIGMAATLVGLGYLLLRTRMRLERHAAGGRWPRLVGVASALPVATSSLLVVGGVVIALRSGFAA